MSGNVLISKVLLLFSSLSPKASLGSKVIVCSLSFTSPYKVISSFMGNVPSPIFTRTGSEPKVDSNIILSMLDIE